MTERYVQGLLKLENDRRDNSEQIVILFHSMAKMLSVLTYLDQRVLVDDDPLTIHLGEILYASCATMEEFGDLSDLYYNKCKQPIVRFMKAGDFKNKISDFADRFAQHRAELQEILVIRNEVRSGDIFQGIEELRENTQKIIARLGEPASEQEIKAIELVRSCGKDRVLHDKAMLEELSGMIGGGKVSGNTQALLESNLDELLTLNMDQFHRKLDSSMNQISESVNKSRDAILKKACDLASCGIPKADTFWLARLWTARAD
ncbi:hypothetical protein M408DRAFT_31290 [Serendipita vermifera MAFF 305830]|uniref:Uncharacterized protein n=1 Tax=Serendipita vermifera MAFF 305830 TaxID=933852 RepID=A0A0C3AJ56_SERVB|nr:hypothetical protein M408DRAFT_31290 [Serendipita vermifera MAFF 305830]